MVPRRRSPVMSTLAAATLIMPSCWVMSIHPLWRPDEPHPFDARLVGNWWQREADCKWQISAVNGEYHVAYSNSAFRNKHNLLAEHGVAEFHGYLVQIGGCHFLDLLPVNVITTNPQLVAAHAIYRIAVEQHAIELVPLNAEFVVKAIARREIAGRVDHEQWADCAVITAPTSRVSAFVSAHSSDVAAFTDVDDQGGPYWRFEPLPAQSVPAEANIKGAAS